MNSQFLKTSALVVTILGLTSSQLCAQLGIKSVGSVQKKDGPMQVTVVFSGPVDPVTGAAIASYNLGAGVTINAASMMTGLPGLSEPGNGDPPLRGRVINNQCAVLEVTGLGTATTTLTVSGVKNAALTETLNTTTTFVPSGYTWVEMGRMYTQSSDPGWTAPGHREGKVISDSTNGFDLFNNGRTGWAGTDEFTFAYKPVTGDFEFKSRLEFADSASRWSRAGIMVRERIDQGTTPGCFSRYMTAHADPPRAFSDTAAGVVAGNNTYESNARVTDYSGADTAQADTSPICGNGQHIVFDNDTVGGGGGVPQYPIAWVRLIRQGDTVTAAWSNDGAAWTDITSRTFDPPLPATLFWGPAYCAEWGNINAANGDPARSRYYLTQHRWGQLTTPYVVGINGSPQGFVATVQDLQTKFVKSTLQMWLDDVSVTATSVTGPDATGLSTITYTAPEILPVGPHSVKIQFNDNGIPPNLITKIGTFDVSYVAVPEEYATTTFSGAKGNLTVSAHKMPTGTTRGFGDNTVVATETELQDGFPVVSEVDTTPQPMSGVINFTQSPLDAGYFNSANPPENPYPDGLMPAGVGNPGDLEYAMQFYGYAEMKKGAYRMFVNSDDGFKLSIGPNALDVLGMRLGVYDAGRGHSLNADPAAFDFVITKDGVYPFRLIFEQGGGDASVEWYVLNSAGTRVLINDTGAPVQTYGTGRGRAYVKKFLPYPGSNGVDPRPTLTFQIVDDLTTVADSSVKVILDGTDITASASKVRSGGTFTVTWTPTADYLFESKHTGELIYTEQPSGTIRTNAIDFTVKGFLPADLPANSFWIEVEDFDYNKGQYLPLADTAIGTDPATAYTGGGYADLVGQGFSMAVNEIDYHKAQQLTVTNADGSLGGYVYRTDIPGWANPPTDTIPGWFVPLGGKTDAGVANTRPGGVTITVNYNTAWSGGSWYNYTRTIPNGIYNVFLAACHWNNTDAPAAGQIDSALDKVTAGLGTTSQTLQRLGTFYGPANGTTETYTRLKGSDGTAAVIKFNGKTSLRLTVNAGDSDYIVLAPVSGVPAKITDATPANGAVASRSTPISVRIEDFSTTATLATVKLFVDTVDVTTQANPAKTADITTMSYLPAGGWAANSTHTYIVRFTDSASAVIAVTNTFTVNALGAPGQFVIEAEDFNYGSGQAMPAASVMPYATLAYSGLDAVFDVDFHNDDNPADSPLYRNCILAHPNRGVSINENGGAQASRGTWTLATNYKIGWAGTGDWQNYTRTFPQGTYTVYAALSDGSDPVNPHGLAGSFDLVTSGATTTSQTLVRLGTFDQIGTGPNSWGNNALVPMKDGNGAQASVNLNGSQTVRFNSTSGDMDYFLFVPGATATAAAIVTPPATQSVAAGANVTFTVAATGTGPLTYQWNFKGAPLAGQTEATLAVNNAQAANAGAYTVTVTAATGAPVTSAEAVLTVTGGGGVQISGITLNTDKTITVTWTGGGVLEVTTSLKTPIQWQVVDGAASPYTFTPNPANGPFLFGRIRVP